MLINLPTGVSTEVGVVSSKVKCGQQQIVMAYSRGPTTALKSSASLVPGNLAVLIGLEGDSSLTYVVTHKGCANIVHTSSGVCTQEQVTFDATGDKDPASHLIQVSLFTVVFSICACSQFRL